MNSPILDLAIVLIFTYLLLSIIASTIYEAFLTVLKARNKMLKHAFSLLFFDDEWRERTSKLLMDSPTIKALKKSDTSFPAYIPASSFTSAIIGLIRNGSTDPINIDTIRARLNDESSIIKGEARIALLNIIDNAENDYDKFLKGLAKFYDDYMDRVSGWFKVKYHKIMFIISVVITLILNVDTIEIAKTLWANPSQLHTAADAASNQFNEMSLNNENQVITKTSSNGQTLSINLVHHIDTTTISPDSAQVLLAQQTKIIASTIDSLNNSVLPLGWKSPADVKETLELKTKLIVKIFGWLLTALAVFMGAPTWFQILSKLVNLRGTGSKPEKSTSTETTNG